MKSYMYKTSVLISLWLGYMYDSPFGPPVPWSPELPLSPGGPWQPGFPRTPGSPDAPTEPLWPIPSEPTLPISPLSPKIPESDDIIVRTYWNYCDKKHLSKIKSKITKETKVKWNLITLKATGWIKWACLPWAPIDPGKPDWPMVPGFPGSHRFDVGPEQPVIPGAPSSPFWPFAPRHPWRPPMPVQKQEKIQVSFL